MQATQVLIDKAISQSNSREVLDFRGLDFDREFFGYGREDYAQAATSGGFVKPVVCISNEINVKIIYFPLDWDYVVFDNLPNLEELHIGYGNGSKKYLFRNLQWMICRNLPNLKKITINCDLMRWLQIDGAESLQSIDLSKAGAIDFLSISNAPSVKEIDVKGCKKLKEASGMDQAKQSELGVTSQIDDMQAKSKCDGTLYKNMTFTDVEHVLWTINYGVKIASLKGLFQGDEDTCYGREDDPDFNNFSFALLRPLEFVYTGGTGETYAYEVLCHDYSNGQYGAYDSVGNGTQEDCLDYALHTLSCMYLDIPGKQDPTNKQILAFLKKLVAKETLS